MSTNSINVGISVEFFEKTNEPNNHFGEPIYYLKMQKLIEFFNRQHSNILKIRLKNKQNRIVSKVI